MFEGMKKGDLIYATLRTALDEVGWKYEPVDEQKMILSGVRGDDLIIDVKALVYEDLETICYASALPFDVPKEQLVAMSVALNATNYELRDGCFIMDPSDGSVLFKLTTCYHDCKVGKGLFMHYLQLMCTIVDEYDQKLSDLANGKISLKEYLEFLQA